MDEDEYIYITYLIKNTDLYLDNLKTNNYDLISVVFTEPHTHQYKLEKYGTNIKTDIEVETVQIENNYLLDNKYSPYVLVKLSNNKFGYIHSENFDPIEFENQEQIKNKLLNFLLVNNSP